MRINHLDHIEDIIFDGDSILATIILNNCVHKLMKRDYGQDDIIISEKIDGAPAVFIGHDPRDGRFFVATKSIFNKHPEVFYSLSELKQSNKPTKDILKILFKEFRFVEFEGIIQGDYLGDQYTIQEYYQKERKWFAHLHPNTLHYFIEDDEYKFGGVAPFQSKLIIAWHTVYSGNSLETLIMKDVVREFPHDNDVLNIIPVVNSFMKFEFDNLAEYVKHHPSDGRKYLPGFQTDLRKFINYRIKNGTYFNYISNLHVEFVSFLDEECAKKIQNLKKTESKRKWLNIYREKKAILFEMLPTFMEIMRNHKKLTAQKEIIMNHLNRFPILQPYCLDENNKYRLTNPEGYVVHFRGMSFKLVRRNEFSRMNFNNERWSKL